MLKSFIISKYLAKKFLKIISAMTFAFFCLFFILNVIEEINFFKDFNVGIEVPIILSTLFVPTLLYEMFPFIVLLSGIWFFLKIKKNDEIIALKLSGLSNISIILIPSILAIFLGIIFITTINPVTSVLVKKYESIKGAYEKDQDYLASVTVNGIYIKEKSLDKNFIIRSSNIENNYLIDVTIYEFDYDNNFLKRINAKSADISFLDWELKDVKIFDKEGVLLGENIESYAHRSMYDIKKIKSLYSNLDTISFWSLSDEIKLMEIRGYSTREMRSKLQKSLVFPLFLLSMVLLSGVFTLRSNLKENNWTYVFIAIIVSVLIYYFNDFSAVLGKTEKLPMEIAVWMPLAIIFVFSAVGIIHANQK